MTDKGTLIVFSGPSGSGKGTILSNFYSSYADDKIKYSVSATTRNPREGEKDGVNYFFKTKEEFENMISDGQFLEWAKFCDNYYGTPKKAVTDLVDSGYDVILEIETVGAMNVKKNFPDAVMVFVLPPSVEELKKRLSGRGTETEDVIEKRIETALGELPLAQKYDYVIVNDEVEKATEKFWTIVRAERLKTNKNKKTIIEVCEK
ncbi:MAG: guanylate kinase [Ruminococcaceae bacterium]|nr:guanylate kinase [Oscillospiraceae bacterium]